jgi:hypothetical protein
MKRIKYLIPLTLLLFSLLNVYTNYIQQTKPIIPQKVEEEFDASLLYIRSINQLIAHVDSLNSSSDIIITDSLNYANLMARTLRMRFVHGWSKYTWKNNWALALLNPLHPHIMGIVKPDDILNYSDALCSQQSIIGMEALKRKGFRYRKVGFFKDNKGHFTYEILLNDGWHYYDLDKEPSLKFMEKNNRPSINRLANDSIMRNKAYKGKDPWIADKLLKSYDNDNPINVFPARKMRFLHRITLFISYWSWLIFGLSFLWWDLKHKN